MIGLVRLVSMLAVGLSNPFFIAMTVLELLIPFLMAFMQSRISKSATIQPAISKVPQRQD